MVSRFRIGILFPHVSTSVASTDVELTFEFKHSLLIAFCVYLGLGAYYNYSTYGASGLDLIPYVSFVPQFPTALTSSSSGIAISGGKCPTCFATSYRTYARQCGRDNPVVAGTLPYETCWLVCIRAAALESHRGVGDCTVSPEGRVVYLVT